MNPPKYQAIDYINFLIATQKAYSCVEAARVQPLASVPAHDAVTRLLHRLEPNPDSVWEEAKTLVSSKQGILVIDDTTLDKVYAEKMELVSWRSQAILAVPSRKQLLRAVW